MGKKRKAPSATAGESPATPKATQSPAAATASKGSKKRGAGEVKQGEPEVAVLIPEARREAELKKQRRKELKEEQRNGGGDIAPNSQPESADTEGNGVELKGEKEDGSRGGGERSKSEVGTAKASSGMMTKEKVLVLSSRGIVYRYRHLMMDLLNLLPHSKKESKLESSKSEKAQLLTELADLRGCTSCIYFEMRKKKDLYLWMSKSPNGPSAKFLLSAVHTMAELKLTGNHLKGSRPLLTFSPSFDALPHLQLLKELFTQIFATPKGHRKSKPFFDHVITFSFVDNHIWFRNYQIVVPNSGDGKIDKGALEKMTLIEVGPRFCLNTIKIFNGNFGGATLYENPTYISPNAVRSKDKAMRAGKYLKKVKAKSRRKNYVEENHMEPDALSQMWRD